MILDEHKLPALYMLWQGSGLPELPQLSLGYTVRTYSETDYSNLLDLLSIDGGSMSNEELKNYRDKILPKGLFLISHTDELVATAGAVHNPNPGRYYFPFGGELGYLMVHPDHRRKGLGEIVSSLVVKRFLSAGYESIRVGVQGFRLPAIRTYLKVGFVPFVYNEDLTTRWRRIYEQINRPYEPEKWPTNAQEGF